MCCFGWLDVLCLEPCIKCRGKLYPQVKMYSFIHLLPKKWGWIFQKQIVFITHLSICLAFALGTFWAAADSLTFAWTFLAADHCQKVWNGCPLFSKALLTKDCCVQQLFTEDLGALYGMGSVKKVFKDLRFSDLKIYQKYLRVLINHRLLDPKLKSVNKNIHWLWYARC